MQIIQAVQVDDDLKFVIWRDNLQYKTKQILDYRMYNDHFAGVQISTHWI